VAARCASQCLTHACSAWHTTHANLRKISVEKIRAQIICCFPVVRLSYAGTKGPGLQTKPCETRVGQKKSAALRRKPRANHGPGHTCVTLRRSCSTALKTEMRQGCSAYIYIKYITSNIWIRQSECMIKIKPITI